MFTQSLYCPNCGAPLSFKAGQEVMICIYCNSSIRVSHQEDAKPALNLIAGISPDVVDEVKRLLVMGFATRAVKYYITQSNLSQKEAYNAVSAIKKTVGYRPPLNAKGFAILLSLFSVSIGIICAGIFLNLSGMPITGAGMIFAAILFAYMNWFAFRSSLSAYFLLKRGITADAVILKQWQVTAYPIKQGGESLLLRLLVEVRPAERETYHAEANCLVSDKNKTKFNTGSIIKVKYNRKNPASIIVSGTE